MEWWKKIRLEVLRGETSKREILRRERIHWKTLKKILSYSEPPGYRMKRARPNEKGVVEGTVKYTRQNYLVPVPQVRNLKELNTMLEENCRDDMKRRLRGRAGTKAELMVEDQAAFFPLPPSPFDACRKRSTRAGSLSLVRFDDNDYSVPVAYAYHEILAKGYIEPYT